MKLSIGSDHGGFELKQVLLEYLQEQGHEVIDHGPSSNESVDYPDYAHAVALSVSSAEAELGVLICTSGVGVSIAANKVKGIRAGLAFNEDVACYMRLHNDANIICLGQKYITPYMAKKLVDVFLSTSFEGGRHQRRIKKIEAIKGA